MGGTKLGGKRAARTNRFRYGKNFYAIIGKVGGEKGKSGGFASLEIGEDGLTGPERARTAGSKGGSISKRRKIIKPYPLVNPT